jgi:hypothetical protein
VLLLFQLGGLHVLKKAVPDATFAIIGEQPGYPSYWNLRGGNPANYFDMASEMDTDVLVLMGPMFRPETEDIWGGPLKKLLARGTKLVLLGVAAMQYEEDHIRAYRQFLKKYPPFIFTSRDTETFERLGDLATYAYDGIDFGFFLSDVYQPVGFRSEKERLILNFDKIPEPNIRIDAQTHNKPDHKDPFEQGFTFNGESWTVRFPKFRTKLAQRSRQLMFLEGVLFRDQSFNEIGSYEVIRTDHRPHPMISRKTYRSKNMFFNDTPYPYLEIYSQGVLTLSNRIHACVAAMNYDKPAMLFSSSPRVRMLERVGLQDILKRPVVLDREKLDIEKENLTGFLQDHFARL